MPGDRVGTLAWNGYRHFELYYAVSGMGAVIHTINPRLFPDQITYIVNHAEDRYCFFDLTFAPLVERLAPQCQERQGLGRDDRSRAHAERCDPEPALLRRAARRRERRFRLARVRREHRGRACATRPAPRAIPKGVLYSHRSTLLHAYATSLPDVKNFSARSVVLPIVPMFHVNAWGIPYAAPLVGAKLVFRGRDWTARVSTSCSRPSASIRHRACRRCGSTSSIT